MSESQHSSDEEYFDCTEPFPSKFYAVAVPRSSPGAGLFSNIAQAKSRLKSVKGSRLKAFDSIQEASVYSSRPVQESAETPSQIPEGEAVKYPSIKQQDLLRFRKYIESNDIDSLKKCVADNPMYLITGYDTPTILQLVFRFNAMHIAAKVGRPEVIKLVISYVESPDFWARIYPNAEVRTAEDRRQRVLDLYLNSPETGSLSTPLHMASKFGHVECVRVLANHPTTILDLRDHLGATALDSACTRLLVDSNCPSLEEKSSRRQVIVRALDERYVILVDRSVNSDIAGAQPLVLPCGLMGRQLHNLLAATKQLACPGVAEFCPHLVSAQQRPLLPFTPAAPQTPTKSSPQSISPNSSPFSPFSPRRVISVPVPSVSMSPSFHSPMEGSPEKTGIDLREYGASGQLVLVRAILGPLDTEEAKRAVANWKKPRNTFWMNLRMMDSEKGYERFGRRLAKELNTKWTEHWNFLDDFADLQSPYGLGLLNDYLSQLYVSETVHPGTEVENSLPHFAPIGGKLNFDDSSEVGEMKEDEKDLEIKKIPTKRVKCEVDQAKIITNGRDSIERSQWTVYREDNNPEHVLNDSLDDSGSSSASSDASTGSQANSGGSKPQTPKEQVSPVIGLLNSFTVTSPLRLLLPPPCVGSTFTRPEKRISMFSRDGSNVNLTSDLLESTPLKSTPGMIPRSANIRSARRHLIDGVWPSILGTKAVGVGDGGSHLLAAISASEMSVHNALKCEGASGDGEKREVDLESYPFVKRWKKELDLSFQRP